MNKVVFLTFVLIAFSCKKENEPKEQKVSGLLLQNVTKLPLAGQKVDLYVTESWIDKSRRDVIEAPDGLPTYYTNKFSVITDVSGRYSFNFTVAKDWFYDLHINTPEYIFANSSKRWALTTIIRPPDIAYNLSDTLYAEKPAYIKYLIQNISPANENDSLHINWGYGKYTKNGQKLGLYSWSDLFKINLSVYPPCIFLYSGANVNKEISDTVPCESIRKYSVKWIYSKNGIIMNVQDSIPVTPFSTSIYNIHY